MMIPLVLIFAAIARAACLPVTGESIRARELAAANPVFASLDSELAVGAAPSPGAKRVFQMSELTRLAAAHGLDRAGLHEVCFEWTLKPPPKTSLLEAMRKALGARTAAIEIIEQSAYGAPQGEIVFQLQRIAPAPGPDRTLFLWKGHVRYGDRRTFPIWAKVKITAEADRVRARVALAPYRPITAEQVEVFRAAVPFAVNDEVESPGEVVGRAPRAAIEPGRPIRRGELIEIPEVAAGERVQVEVRNGAMRVLTEGRAGRAGRLGEFIPVVNETSGARFQARVDGRARTVVTLSPGGHGTTISQGAHRAQ